VSLFKYKRSLPTHRLCTHNKAPSALSVGYVKYPPRSLEYQVSVEASSFIRRCQVGYEPEFVRHYHTMMVLHGVRRFGTRTTLGYISLCTLAATRRSAGCYEFCYVQHHMDLLLWAYQLAVFFPRSLNFLR
jgi:hypothetical protein